MQPSRATILRLTIVLLALAGLVLLLVGNGITNPAAIERLIGARAVGSSRAAPLIYILISIIATLAFVPRTALAIAAGLVFGFWWGLFWAMLGSLVGSLIAFLLGRYVSAGWIDETTLPKLTPLLQAVDRSGWRGVALTRLAPVPNAPVNYALALTRISAVTFCLGSALGMLPSSIVAVQLGADGNYALTGGHWLVPTLLGVGLLLISLLVPRLPFFRRSFRPAE